VGSELAATPLPVSVIVLAVDSLSDSAIVAVLAPVVLGVNCAEIVQLCSNASVRPEQPSAMIAKSVESADTAIESPEIESACAPTFVTTITDAGEGCPTV
jgi:hypothetical protein